MAVQVQPRAQGASPKSHWRFTGNEAARLGGFFGFVALLHALGWGFFLMYAHEFGRVYAGATGALMKARLRVPCTPWFLIDRNRR